MGPIHPGALDGLRRPQYRGEGRPHLLLKTGLAGQLPRPYDARWQRWGGPNRTLTASNVTRYATTAGAPPTLSGSNKSNHKYLHMTHLGGLKEWFDSVAAGSHRRHPARANESYQNSEAAFHSRDSRRMRRRRRSRQWWSCAWHGRRGCRSRRD